MKKRVNLITKRIIVVMQCAFVLFTTINPNFATYVYANSMEIQGVFNETLAEDKTSTTVDLRIDEVEDKTIESITLPDQSVVVKENFKRDDNTLLFEYTTTENKKLDFVVEYIENKVESSGSTELISPQEATTEVKKETLTYEVKDIVAPKESTLIIDAKDINFKVGEDVDFRKDVTIKDENDIDITDQLNFDIVNYDGYIANKIGAYHVEYSVTHPISSENFSFSRNVTVDEGEKLPLENSDTGSINKGSIELTSSNATFKTPEDFDLSDKSQEVFNLSVHYAPANADVGRKLVIDIPENFRITKVPGLSDFHGIDSITVKGNSIILTVPDSLVVDIAFDITLTRSTDNIYKLASKADYKADFTMNGYKNGDENVYTSGVQIGLPKFTNEGYTFESKLNLLKSDIETVGAGHSYTLTIKREKYTPYDSSLAIKIPTVFDELVINHRRYIDYKIGDRSYKKVLIPYQVDGYSVVEFQEADKYAYSNDPIEITINLPVNHSIYSNGFFESTKELAVLSDFGEQQLGKFTVDTRITAIVKPEITKDANLLKNGMGGYSDVTFEGVNFSNIPGIYVFKDITYTYEIPYEMEIDPNLSRPTERGIKFLFYTNMGREMEYDSTGNVVLDLAEGEWISKVVTTMYNVKYDTNTGLNVGYSAKLKLRIRDKDAAGNPYTQARDIEVKATIESTDPNVVPVSRTTNFNIVPRNIDEIELFQSSNAVTNKEIAYTSSNKNLVRFGIKKADGYEQALQIYDNLKIQIEDKELLSLVSGIRFYSGLTHSTIKNNKVNIFYTTNKNSELQSRELDATVKQPEFLFELEEGDYLESLYLVYDKYDPYDNNLGNKNYDGILLFSSSVPKVEPLTGKDLNDIYYNTKVTVTADNSTKTRVVEGTTPTFKWKEYKPSIKAIDNQNIKVNMNSSSNHIFLYTSGSNEDIYEFPKWELGRVEFSGQSFANAFVYENLNIEISADEELMALTTGLKMTSQSGIDKILDVSFYTNLGNKIDVQEWLSYTRYIDISKKLAANEYVTKVTIHSDTFETTNIHGNEVKGHFALIGEASTKSKISGDFFGLEYKNYPIKAIVSADNIEQDEETDGISSSISGEVEINLSNDPSINAAHGGQLYQGNTFDVSISNPPLGWLVGSRYPSFHRMYHEGYELVDPIFYLEVDSNYKYVAGSIEKIDGFEPTVTYLNKKTNDGHSVIKIDMTGYTKVIKLSTDVLRIRFKMMVDPSAEPAKNIKPLHALWTDLTSTKVDHQEGTKAKLTVLNEVEDTKNIQDGTSNYLVKRDLPNSGVNEILPINEMGIGNLAELDGSVGALVKGHDNDLYSQQLSIISNHQSPTKDWIVYVPVPKKGKTVTYQESVDGAVVTKQSEPAKYSMNLAEKVSIPGLPADATIEYSVDENPTYVLDGTTVGNYSANIEASQLHEVTMIKITIPELAAREKLYPVIKYQVASNKNEVGLQRVDGGVYFNMKIGTSASYHFGTKGAYSKLVQYDLEDFNVTGLVWEDRDEPSNSIYDRTDSGKSNVEIIATDKDGNEFTTKTINGGSYNLAVPSHGETEIKVILPNELTATPKKEYMFVESGKGTSTTSSVVDRNTGKTKVNLVRKDIHNINVGLTAERALAVTPNDLVIVKGTTMPVPAVAFPSYSIISYQNTADTSIATVSDGGVLTGIELGTTTATISIPDGQGGSGIVSATYNIKVVPANNPSAKFENITIFQGGVVDAMKDITIVDGDGKPIDVNDKSKVTINTDSVDVSEPGRYPITYTIHDGYNEVTATRYVYVHGNIQLVVPNDITKKVGDIVVALDGASATYIHINEDGTQTVKTVNVGTPKEEITSDVVGKVDVPLDARITVEGAEDTASGNYVVTFNEKAKIEVANDKVTIKVGATLDEIKNMINGNASMTTPDGTTDLTPNINWEILDDFDTSKPGNTITGNITVIDPDTGELIEKEITVTISGNVEIKVPVSTDLVEGDIYDPYANVEIIDGDGNVVTLTPEMIVSNTVPTDTDGQRGVYEVEYQYTDKYGNTKREKTTVNVHGKVQFDDTRRDFLQNDSVENVNSLEANKDLAYYIDANGDRKLATLKVVSEASSSIIGKSSQNLEYTHPVNGNTEAFNRAIYVHGHVVISVPNTYTVKVNTEINTLKDVTASYKFVEDDGTIVDRTTPVNSALGNITTSAVPVEKTIPVVANVEVVTGLISNATNSYTIIFNGMPTITTVNDSIEVKIGATFEEIKKIINASASVHYGDEINPTDLTAQINWDEVMAIDTSAKDQTYSVKIYITDKDGVTVEKTVDIKISNEIIMNLPSVDKTVGDNFDPKEDVTIFDGQGNPVDMKDVIIDDSKVDMSKPGNYEVTYTYTDSLGNTETKTNTIRVHGEMQFEGIDRIDLIENDVSYVVDSTKAFYIDNDGKKVYVEGVYDKPVLDQSVVGKNELIYSAVHPISNVKESSEKLNVFIHGDIVFHKPIDILTGKVNTTLKPNTGVSATFDFVNDDGTITTKDVPVTSEDVTSNTVGYIDGMIDAKVEVVAGLVNTKGDTVKVGFNGLPYIEAANTISYNGRVPSKSDIINKMMASAGMKQANGVVIDLTHNIDYSDVDRVVLDKNGNYQITLTVTDIDGFTTYAVVNVIVNIPTIKPDEPNIPGPPIDPTNPTNPTNPTIPGNPQFPVRPNIPTPPLNPVEKDTAAVVSRDIPLSEAEKNTITDDFIKSYITASTEKNGIVDFEILSHNVLPKVGEYEVSIRLEDGRVVSVKIKVVDDGTKDVDQPDYGHDKDCIIHWFILLLFAGYSIYSIAAMLKRRKDTNDLEEALEEMGAYELNGEGVEQNEN